MKALYEFPESVAGESEVCIACGEASARALATQQSLPSATELRARAHFSERVAAAAARKNTAEIAESLGKYLRGLEPGGEFEFAQPPAHVLQQIEAALALINADNDVAAPRYSMKRLRGFPDRSTWTYLIRRRK